MTSQDQLKPGQWLDNCPDVFETARDVEDFIRLWQIAEAREARQAAADPAHLVVFSLVQVSFSPHFQH
jgi:hypothetical protein